MADYNSVNAIIKNGEVVNGKTESSKNSTAPKGYDKDAFMQILVAQMKYQDPLEPTSNTEYISQYATFTQVEQLSNMANAMSLSRASEMVGKTVTIVQSDSDTGKSKEIQGVVEAYLNVDGVNYNINDVKEVLDPNFTAAIEEVKDFQEAIDKLPSLEMISDENHGLTIDTMYTYYTEGMSDKAKKMMDKNYVTSLLQYVNRIDDLREDKHRAFTDND